MTITIPRKHVLAALAGVAALITVLAGCSPADSGTPSTSGASGKKTDVTIQIDGSAVPYYAPLYEAADQGYFANNGLNVSFTYAQGSDILQNVAAGNVQFGFPNGDSVITAKGKGVDVNVVHTTYQQGIGAVLFNKNTSGITSPADLKGKTVAVTDLGSPNYIQLQAMLQKVGLSISDVTVKTIGTGAIVQALQAGQVDAIVFSRLRYFALQAAGFPVGQILSDQYLPSFGNVLVTSPSYLKSDPAAVKGFVAALNKGIEYVIAHPASSVKDAIDKYAPTFKGQEASVTTVIQDVYIKDLWQSADTKKHGLGYGDLTRWQQAIDAQVAYKLIDQSYSAKSLVVEPDALK
ncbi:MAG: ABC transporter substrate-binding protein [Microbacteriaceae bacterium]|nr:MAG: ABC transporter substrate-binding protein [Microbacteriaceae bacterium]